MRGCGCIARPAFPAPPSFQGGRFMHNSGASRREIAEVCLRSRTSILPSLRGAKRRSNPHFLLCEMNCFAPLAMTTVERIALRRLSSGAHGATGGSQRAVIARSEATKQSTLSSLRDGLLRSARNDDGRADCFVEPVIGRAFAQPVGSQ